MKYLRGFLFVVLALFMIVEADYKKEHQVREPLKPKYERRPLEDRNYVYYTVQAGDTLDEISRKFRIASPESILNLNPGVNGEKLPVNRDIKIPLQ